VPVGGPCGPSRSVLERALMVEAADLFGSNYELVRELLAEPGEEHTLTRVVQGVADLVAACDFAGISIRRGKGRIETPARTAPIVDDLDGAQYELNEGPCLDAIRVTDTIVIDDTATDPRWPTWGPRAAELGARSVLSVRLATADQLVGGLNLYSTRTSAFDEDSVQVAHAYAEPASTAVAVVEKVEGLRTGMQTRHLIGMAQGMLMLRYGLNEEQSFAFLSRTSQQSNVKLRDIAVRVCEQLAGEGWPG
jgi:transcriptional regulator with GAF, ATPase, and Fis domain